VYADRLFCFTGRLAAEPDGDALRAAAAQLVA
jgi:hypothetical protein